MFRPGPAVVTLGWRTIRIGMRLVCELGAPWEARTLGDCFMTSYMVSKKDLEADPKHPMATELKKLTTSRSESGGW